MDSKNVVIYNNFNPPKEIGRHQRLVCIAGPERGKIYYLKGDRIIIGRSDKSDIPIRDAKISREHAELKKLGNSYVISDLNSINGIFVNENKVKQAELEESSRIVIGKSVFKFGYVDVSEQDDKNNQTSFVGRSSPQDPSALDEELTNELGKENASSKGRKKILIYLVILLLGLFLLDSPPPAPPKKEADLRSIDEFSKLLEQKKLSEDKVLKEKLDQIFHRGLREMREENYFRAITEFNLALIIDPQNSRAKFYLDKVDKALDTYIKSLFLDAKYAQESLKYRDAANIYCSVVRFLQSSKEKKQEMDEALEKIKEMEKLLGLEAGEIKCIEE